MYATTSAMITAAAGFSQREAEWSITSSGPSVVELMIARVASRVPGRGRGRRGTRAPWAQRAPGRAPTASRSREPGRAATLSPTCNVPRVAADASLAQHRSRPVVHPDRDLRVRNGDQRSQPGDRAAAAERPPDL